MDAPKFATEDDARAAVARMLAASADDTDVIRASPTQIDTHSIESALRRREALLAKFIDD